MRFLDVALNGLFPVADSSVKGIGTDGTLLSFETGYICGWYRRNPVYVNRMILHETFHCPLCPSMVEEKAAGRILESGLRYRGGIPDRRDSQAVRPSADVTGAGRILRTSEEKDQGIEC